MFQGKDETDAGRLEKSDSKEEQPKNLKEWFHESKAVAKRLGSSKVYVLNNISGRVVCQKNVNGFTFYKILEINNYYEDCLLTENWLIFNKLIRSNYEFTNPVFNSFSICSTNISQLVSKAFFLSFEHLKKKKKWGQKLVDSEFQIRESI